MKKIAFLILIVTLFTACSVNKSYDFQKDFIQKIERWNDFSLSGIIRITYKNLTLSKNIKIQKNNDSASINIFEGGVFGNNSKILFHVKIDSVVQIENIFANSIKLNSTIEEIDGTLQMLKNNANRIIKTRKFVKKNLIVEFNQSLEISTLNYKDLSLIFNYQNNLSSISILKDKKEIASIEVDKIKFFGAIHD